MDATSPSPNGINAIIAKTLCAINLCAVPDAELELVWRFLADGTSSDSCAD
jgi:hypothetical protein